METVIISSIYNEIIEYYTNKTFDELEEEDANYREEYSNDIGYKYDSDKEHIIFSSVEEYIEEVNNRKNNNGDFRCEIRSSNEISDNLMEDDIFMNRRFAYRKHESLDQKETDIETISNYLPKHFRYLMQNVFYVDMKKYKAKGSRGSYFIYKKDAEIFRVILLKSVSQNQHDLIIRRWLEGKISKNDYHEIVELAHRLFVLIENTKADSEVKKQWIEALSIALQIDFAYTMVEIEFTVKEIFSSSLPFKVNNSDSTKDTKSEYSSICHAYFKDSILAELDTNDMTAQNTILSMVCEYLKTTDFDKMNDNESFPPVELLKMKCICEMLYPVKNVDKSFPNVKMINTYGNYFTSIDKEFMKKIENRKKIDQERYQRNIAKAHKKKS